MSEGMLAAITGLAALIIGVLQWWFSLQAAARQRDAEMTRWGGEVIDMMAELEGACMPLSSGSAAGPREADVLSQRASALVDKGRLFFPNVRPKGSRPEDEGTRVKILDEVLRACYVARHVATGGDVDREVLRGHVWQARRRFVSLLQKEMGKSLRKVGTESEGEHVPLSPRFWDPPTRKLNLPRR